jgi:hypothetical protein
MLRHRVPGHSAPCESLYLEACRKKFNWIVRVMIRRFRFSRQAVGKIR